MDDYIWESMASKRLKTVTLLILESVISSSVLITDMALFHPAAYSGRTIWTWRQEGEAGTAWHVLFHFYRQAQLQDNHCPRPLTFALHHWHDLEPLKHPFALVLPQPRTLQPAVSPRKTCQRHHENLRRVQILRQDLLMKLARDVQPSEHYHRLR